MKLFITATAMTFALATTAHAADIINKDTKTYEISITCDGATTKATVGPNTTQSDAVTKGCFIKLNNKSYTIKGESHVIIKGGKPQQSDAA